MNYRLQLFYFTHIILAIHEVTIGGLLLEFCIVNHISLDLDWSFQFINNFTTVMVNIGV
jgi:hypothetical protein